MEEFIFTANIVLPLFFLIVLGVFCRKAKIISQEFLESGNKLSFKVLLPVMLFYSVYNGRNMATFNGKFSLQLIATIILMFAILWLVLRFIYKDERKLSVMIQVGFRSNFVLFGTYLMSSLYGESGVTMVSCYLAIIVSMFNVFATFILEFYSPNGRKNGGFAMLKKILKNPLLIASLLGLTFYVTKWNLATILETTISNVASIATIFSMIILGGNLKMRKIKEDKWNIMFGTTLRLVIVPLVVCSTFYLLGYRAEMFAIVLIIFATPAAVSSYIMAEQQGADGDLACGLIASTTLFSMFTLFAFIYTAKVMGIF